MPGTVVGLYCAVVERFDPFGIDAHDRRMRNAGGLHPTGEEPSHLVGRTEPWFSGGLAAGLKTAPRGQWASARSIPPWASMMERHIDRPIAMDTHATLAFAAEGGA